MTLPMIDATYRARACGAAQFAESNNGNMQIAVPFEILDEHDSPAGETITWFATFHSKADKTGKTGKDRIVESLLYMGFAGDDLLALMDITDDEARALMPNVVDLVCGPDDYQNPETGETTTSLKVKWVNRPGGGRAGFKKPLSKDEARAFAAQMRSNLRNARGPQKSNGAGGTRPVAPTHPNAPGADDDIQF